MGLRKGEVCGVGLVRECWWVLEYHWLWADVQVEGGVERDARVRKVEWCPRRKLDRGA